MKKKKKVLRKKVVTKPVKKLSYEEYQQALKHPKWQKKRLKIFERDRWRCRKCNNAERTLHVHHKAYTKRYPWNEPNKNLITLCELCHKKNHKK